MDTSKLIGLTVRHISKGSGIVSLGTISYIDNKYVKVRFNEDDIRKFQFPQAFTSYLRLDNDSLMSEILTEFEKQEEDKRKKEKMEKKHDVAAKEPVQNGYFSKKQQATNSEEKNNIRSKTWEENRNYKDGIIGPKTSFATHADTLNTCFGFHYKHFQKAYKDLGNGYAVWFPRIAKKAGDQYLSSDNYWGWLNILSDSGDTITQLDNPDFPYKGEGRPDNNKRIIFARFDNDTRYRFIGIYVFSRRINNGELHTRIGTTFDTKKMRIIEP